MTTADGRRAADGGPARGGDPSPDRAAPAGKAPAGTGPMFLTRTAGANGPGPSGQRPTPVSTRSAYCPARCCSG